MIRFAYAKREEMGLDVMNIDALRIFCDVVNHQSFSRAADVNGVSQSAATQTVHRIEKELGVKLVDRSKRPFVLTPEGQLCYDSFREVLEMFEAATARVRSLRTEVSGVVRVGAIYSVGLSDMSRCMQQFMREYPRARIELEFLPPVKVYEAVQNSTIDLGIVSYPSGSSEIEVIPWRSETMVLVCPPDHPLADLKEVRLEQINNEPFIAFNRDLMIRKEVDRLLRKRKTRIHIVMEFDNIETIKQAIEIGSGLSILPEPTIQKETKLGTVKAIPLTGTPLTRPIGILHHHRKIFTPTAVQFVELLKKMSNE